MFCSCEQNMIEPFLESNRYIDCDHPEVRHQAFVLAGGCGSEEEIARACFHYVRDAIRHSWDWRLNPVTCRASEVLAHGTGFCYAKSHLLAALLRANGIPAGLCYQRLRLEAGGDRFCLHGLNAVRLPFHGWYRLDPRGNKEGVEARFCPPDEHLAFHPGAGEIDLPGIWAEPWPVITEVLTTSMSVNEVYDRLPDHDVLRPLT